MGAVERNETGCFVSCCSASPGCVSPQLVVRLGKFETAEIPPGFHPKFIQCILMQLMKLFIDSTHKKQVDTGGASQMMIRITNL